MWICLKYLRDISETPCYSDWRWSFWWPNTKGVTPAESIDKQSELLSVHHYIWTGNRLFSVVCLVLVCPQGWRCLAVGATPECAPVQGTHMQCHFAVAFHCGLFLNSPDAPQWPPSWVKKWGSWWWILSSHIGEHGFQLAKLLRVMVNSLCWFPVVEKQSFVLENILMWLNSRAEW